MPIFDQGYQHWHGKLSGQAARWLADHPAWGRSSSSRTSGSAGSSSSPSGRRCLLVAFLVVWGLFEQKSAFLTPFLIFIQNLPEELRAGPRGFRTTIWTLAFRQFFDIQLFFPMILVLLVGPDLISQDLRFNAIPLYLSRPVRRFEYFLGKLGRDRRLPVGGDHRAGAAGVRGGIRLQPRPVGGPSTRRGCWPRRWPSARSWWSRPGC